MTQLKIYNAKALKACLTEGLKSSRVEVGRIEDDKIYIMSKYSAFVIPRFVYNEYFGKILKANMPEIGEIKFFNASGEYNGSDTIQQLKNRIDCMLEGMDIPLYKTDYIKEEKGQEFCICSANNIPVLVNRKDLNVVCGEFNKMYINEKHYSLYIDNCGVKTIFIPMRATGKIEKYIAEEFKNE